MPRPPDNGRGRGTDTPASNLQQTTTPAPTRTTTALSLPDRQRWAVAKVRRQDEHLRVCRELEQNGASLVTYYTRPWWWAA
jgi:hypothetical protein